MLLIKSIHPTEVKRIPVVSDVVVCPDGFSKAAAFGREDVLYLSFSTVTVMTLRFEQVVLSC